MGVVFKNISRVKKPTRKLIREDEASPEMFAQAWLSSPLPMFAAAPAPGLLREQLPRESQGTRPSPVFQGFLSPALNSSPQSAAGPRAVGDPPSRSCPCSPFTSRRRPQRPLDGFHPLLHLRMGVGHEHAAVLPCPALLSSHPCENNTFKERIGGEKAHSRCFLRQMLLAPNFPVKAPLAAGEAEL